MSVIKDYLRAFAQLNDPRFWKPVLWATILSVFSILVCVLIGGGVIYQMAGSFSNKLTGWFGGLDGWFSGLAVMVGSLFIFGLGYFFLASVYAAFLGIFLDDALDAVHETHYPDAQWNPPPGIIESAIASLRFILWSLAVYTMASPLLLIGYFVPPVGIVLQILLGGHLLGREYSQLVELRLPIEKRSKTINRLSHGTIATVLWAIPLINLIAPLLLAASLVHCKFARDAHTNG